MSYCKTILFCFVFISLSQAQTDPKVEFEKANLHFENNQIQDAISIYQNLESENILSAELFYNMGNAYYKKSDLARAILYFERGIKYFPNHKELRRNLSKAKEEVQTEILEVEDFFLLRVWNSFSRFLSTTFWGVLQILFLIALAFGLYLWLFKADVKVRRKGFLLWTMGLLFFVISFLAGQTAFKNKVSNRDGIILEQTQLKSGPDERSPEIKPLSNGVKIKIVEELDNWYKVKLLNQQQGWIKKSETELI